MNRSPIWHVKPTTLTPSYKGKSYRHSLIVALVLLVKICESVVLDVVDKIVVCTERFTVDCFMVSNLPLSNRHCSRGNRAAGPVVHHDEDPEGEK